MPRMGAAPFQPQLTRREIERIANNNRLLHTRIEASHEMRHDLATAVHIAERLSKSKRAAFTGKSGGTIPSEKRFPERRSVKRGDPGDNPEAGVVPCSFEPRSRVPESNDEQCCHYSSSSDSAPSSPSSSPSASSSSSSSSATSSSSARCAATSAMVWSCSPWCVNSTPSGGVTSER